MTFGKQLRLAGAFVVIVAFFTNTLILNMIGLMLIAIGVVVQVDNLERRVEALEPKGDHDEEA